MAVPCRGDLKKNPQNPDRILWNMSPPNPGRSTTLTPPNLTAKKRVVKELFCAPDNRENHNKGHIWTLVPSGAEGRETEPLCL